MEDDIWPQTSVELYSGRQVRKTLGGIKVNDRLQVVTDKDKAIPNLYAAGSDVGGMYGDSYDLLMAGSTIGFAVNSGRIAAESAVKDHNLGKK